MMMMMMMMMSPIKAGFLNFFTSLTTSQNTYPHTTLRNDLFSQNMKAFSNVTQVTTSEAVDHNFRTNHLNFLLSKMMDCGSSIERMTIEWMTRIYFPSMAKLFSSLSFPD